MADRCTPTGLANHDGKATKRADNRIGRARAAALIRLALPSGMQLAASAGCARRGAQPNREGEIMIRPTIVLLGALSLAAGVALAKLPPPTPEEQAAAAAKKAQQDKELEEQKAALDRAQDRTVQNYKKNAGGRASSGSGQQTAGKDMPKSTSDAPGQGGPTPQRPFSAEAHSAPAK
jgi:hypothetical protein